MAKPIFHLAAELAPALVFQTFGIGHITQGKVKRGVSVMVLYWVALWLNTLLIPFWIGFLTMPLTWLAFAAYSSTEIAATATERRYLTG